MTAESNVLSMQCSIGVMKIQGLVKRLVKDTKGTISNSLVEIIIQCHDKKRKTKSKQQYTKTTQKTIKTEQQEPIN